MGDGADVFGAIYRNGDVIFRQGEPGDQLFIVQSGAVEISHALGGEEKVIAILEKGALFGELALFNATRSATARAAGTTRVLAFDHSALLERIRNDPGVALHILKSVALKIFSADERLRGTIDEGIDELAEGTGADGAAPVPFSDYVEATGTPEAGGNPEFSELAEAWAGDGRSSWVEANHRVFSQGDPGDAMYIVLEGEVEISRGSGRGKEVFAHLGPGGFFGELAVIVGTTRSADATTLLRTRFMTVTRDEFLTRIASNPELALFIFRSMIETLFRKEATLRDGVRDTETVRKTWVPVFRKTGRLRAAMISLSTCAGCSAVFLDDRALHSVIERLDVTYCPMLQDRTELEQVDIALVDGLVRLKDDLDMLENARAKSRVLVAWGTCGCFGGIPAQANRYTLEELIDQTYGHAEDAFAHYLSGKAGVGHDTYREKGVGLLRHADGLAHHVRVDYHIPGCPPEPAQLIRFLDELTGREMPKSKPLVCGECGRKLAKSEFNSLQSFAGNPVERVCFHSQGVFCAGFLTRGGCGAVCTQAGAPCWGCRGPGKMAVAAMAEGNSYEEVVLEGMAKRSLARADQLVPEIKRLRRESHNLFDFDRKDPDQLRRIR